MGEGTDMEAGRPRVVILAGGPGTSRGVLANAFPPLLYPMTDGQPLVHHLLAFLRASGVREVAFSLSRQIPCRERIETYLSQADDPGLRVHWQTDRGSRGAAGALKDLSWFLGSSPGIVLFSNLWPGEVDLAALWAAHRDSGAVATMVLERAAVDRRDLENVELAADGSVRRVSLLHESRNQRRQLCPAGIYLLEPEALEVIDYEGYVDLKEQLIPVLQDAGHQVHGHVLPAPLSRVDDLHTYLTLARRLLLEWWRDAGAPDAGPAPGEPGVSRGRDVRVAPSAVLVGPVHLHDRCEIGEGARVIGPAVLGSNVRVGTGALVRDSIVWNDCQIGDAASLEYGLMTEGCTLQPAQQVFGALVSHGSTLDEVMSVDTASSIPVLAAGEAAASDGLTLRKLRRVIYLAVKRSMDILLPAAALPVLAPALLLIALAIKLDSPGPVLYREFRCGKGGRQIAIVKFRTMVKDAQALQAELRSANEMDGPMFKVKHDPRITRVGRFLRRTSLDELPQLWGVIRGDLSLVGPRPLVMSEMTWSPRWRDIRLTVKPGLTGLWQVSGRSELGFDGWIENDIHYVRRQSLWLDIRILLRTFKVLGNRTGAV